MEKQLKKGYRLARKITKDNAKTFYFASLLLPSGLKKACYSVYAICRLSDDSVDTLDGDSRLKNIQKIRYDIETAYGKKSGNGPVLKAFGETVHAYDIPKKYFDELLEGMEMDTEKNEYNNFEELKKYCYKVAGVIGLIMLKIFGSSDTRSKTHAVELGIAMQLTNILRDIKEDFNLGRIYLPQDELRDFSIKNIQIEKGEVSPDFKKLMEFQIKRARSYYGSSLSGINMIGNKRCRKVIMLMKNIYSAILDEIEKLDYDVFKKRACVGIGKKIYIALNILR